jgi:hypothetical protein
MPSIDLCFSGWLRGADITTATNYAGEKVDVSQIKPSELAEMLNNGLLTIALGDYLYQSQDAEIEIFDFSSSEQEHVACGRCDNNEPSHSSDCLSGD